MKAWNLIMFELWFETFFENEELKPVTIQINISSNI